MAQQREIEPRKPEELIKIYPTMGISPFSAGEFNSIRALNERREAAAKAINQKKTA